jgi:hypothetical protein
MGTVRDVEMSVKYFCTFPAYVKKYGGRRISDFMAEIEKRNLPRIQSRSDARSCLRALFGHYLGETGVNKENSQSK